MTYKEIQTVIREKGLRQRELAQRIGVSETAISGYLRRRFRSRRLAESLDRELGIKTGLR